MELVARWQHVPSEPQPQLGAEAHQSDTAAELLPVSKSRIVCRVVKKKKKKKPKKSFFFFF